MSTSPALKMGSIEDLERELEQAHSWNEVALKAAVGKELRAVVKRTSSRAVLGSQEGSGSATPTAPAHHDSSRDSDLDSDDDAGGRGAEPTDAPLASSTGGVTAVVRSRVASDAEDEHAGDDGVVDDVDDGEEEPVPPSLDDLPPPPPLDEMPLPPLEEGSVEPDAVPVLQVNAEPSTPSKPVPDGVDTSGETTPVRSPRDILSPRSMITLSPRPGDEISSADGAMLFGLPKLCKFFSSQNRPMSLLVTLVRTLGDPEKGVPSSKRLVGLSRVATFTEKDCQQWLVKSKFTAAASSATRIVELLQKDYVILEVKKGLYRVMGDDERTKARLEDERQVEQKVQKKLELLAKEKSKGSNKTPKSGPVYQVIGAQLGVLMTHQKAEFPTLKVPYLLVRFAADVMALNGQKEEGIFRLSVGTEEVAQMVHRINSENDYTLVRRDPNVAAVMMKRYLRDLPTPLCPDYDRAIAVAKAHEADDVFSDILDSLPECNQAVIAFIANFIALMTSPAVVAATRMDINNYAIVFTPGFVRSATVDMSAMANQAFEQEFTVRMVALARKRWPDDTVGTPESVPQPKETPLTARLVAEEEKPLTPEDLIKQAEERLKNAQRDLREARVAESKQSKKVDLGRSKTSIRAGSLGKSQGRVVEDTVRPRGDSGTARGATPASPNGPQSPVAGARASPVVVVGGGGAAPAPAAPGASIRPLALSHESTNDPSPPKPVRPAPTRGARLTAPELPPLPPPETAAALRPPSPRERPMPSPRK